MVDATKETYVILFIFINIQPKYGMPVTIKRTREFFYRNPFSKDPTRIQIACGIQTWKKASCKLACKDAFLYV